MIYKTQCLFLCFVVVVFSVARDLAQNTTVLHRPVSRRHTISACDTKNGKKVSAPTQHAPLLEEDDLDSVSGSGFDRYHSTRHLTKAKLVSYRQKHKRSTHMQEELSQNPQNVSAQTCHNRQKSELKHAGHCLLSKSHGNLIDSSFSIHNDDMHDVLSSDSCRLPRSASIASIPEPQRCHSPRTCLARSQSPQMFAGRSESPVRQLSRSETFTCSIPRKSRACTRNETHIATRCDSPQTRAMKRMDSFPPRSESPSTSARAESPRRHSIQAVHGCVSGACVSNNSADKPHRYSYQPQHVHAHVAHHRVRPQRHSVAGDAPTFKTKHDHCNVACHNKKLDSERTSSPNFNSKSCSKSLVENVKETVKHVENEVSDDKQKSSVSDLQGSETITNSNTDGAIVRRSRSGVVRARSRPEITLRSRQLSLRQKEEEQFKLIENVGKSETDFSDTNKVSRSVSYRERPTSALDSKTQTKIAEMRARTSGRPSSRLVLSKTRQIEKLTEGNGDSIEKDEVTEKGESDTNTGVPVRPKREVKLSRQLAVRTDRGRVKVNDGAEIARIDTNIDKDDSVKSREMRPRRFGVVSRDRFSSETATDAAVSQKSRGKTEGSSAAPKEEVSSLQSGESSSNEKEEEVPRRAFRPVRPVIRSRSEVRPRPEVKPLKGSHNLPVDFENNNLDHSVDKLVIIPPPEFRDPVDSEDSSDKLDSDSTISGDIGDIPDVIKTSKAEFKVADLLHVSWQCETTPIDSPPTNTSNSSTDFRIPATVSTFHFLFTKFTCSLKNFSMPH